MDGAAPSQDSRDEAELLPEETPAGYELPITLLNGFNWPDGYLDECRAGAGD